MSHSYMLTETGKAIVKTQSGDDEDLRALRFIKDRKIVRENDMNEDTSLVVRHLVRENLVKEV
jgi:hypothetical protein